MELVTALLLPILIIELYTWLPVISEWVLELNVRRLCVENPEQFKEEWRANLNEYPNTLVRLVHALSLALAVSRINDELYEYKLAELGIYLEKISDTHNFLVRILLDLRFNIMKRKKIITDFELSLQKMVASLGTTATANPELRQQVTDLFQKYGHAYLGAFNRTHNLLAQMIDRHSRKIGEIGRSIELSHERYFDATKMTFARWQRAQDLAYLKELENELSILNNVVQHEGECEENDQDMKEVKRITTKIKDTLLQADDHDLQYRTVAAGNPRLSAPG